MGQSDQILRIMHDIGLQFVPFLFALCFHEYAHGLVAKWKGDDTAEMQGRLTMNPVAHMDILGTVILPLLAIIFPAGIFFGWAKPVPVNTRNLKHPMKDMFWIALAGPMSNMLLAVIAVFLCGMIVRFGGQLSLSDTLLKILIIFTQTNLFLAVFNLIPINPLDGGKVIARFLPREISYKLEQHEHVTSIILMVLIFTGMLKILVYPVKFLFFWMMVIAGVPV